AQRRLKKEYEGIELYVAEDPGFPILGAKDLGTFAEAVFGRKPAKWGARAGLSKLKPSAKAKASARKFARAEWPVLSAPLTFVLGKGGVGKTTVSAALGFH